jgi:hypothetical protein
VFPNNYLPLSRITLQFYGPAYSFLRPPTLWHLHPEVAAVADEAVEEVASVIAVEVGDVVDQCAVVEEADEVVVVEDQLGEAVEVREVDAEAQKEDSE